MHNLYIGTSGYDYDEWTNIFYPPTLKKTERLAYYAQHFNALELNSTYYRMPTASQFAKMAEKSERKIKFSIKAFKGITHDINTDLLDSTVSEFKSALEPLQTDSLLLSVLIQFPQSFHYDNKERLYLDKVLKLFTGIPVVLEVRNIKWQSDNVYNELRKRNVGWCITDNPELKDLPRLEQIITSDIAYMRFHGRNKEMWYKGDNVSRYDYLYTDAEIKSFVPMIRELQQKSMLVQLFFNNHAKAQAVVNARKLEQAIL